MRKLLFAGSGQARRWWADAGLATSRAGADEIHDRETYELALADLEDGFGVSAIGVVRVDLEARPPEQLSLFGGE